jgi:hypothetical protein
MTTVFTLDEARKLRASCEQLAYRGPAIDIALRYLTEADAGVLKLGEGVRPTLEEIADMQV